MSHKKANSRIHVPFSWEKMPGVPKFTATPMGALVPGLIGGNNREAQRRVTLPLPPGSLRQPVRSASKRMLLGEEDPFLAAIIECTKDEAKGDHEVKRSFGSKVRMTKSLLSSCKRSFDIKEGTLLMRPSSLGCIIRSDCDPGNEEMKLI